jgi:hypothetical protein
VGCVSIANSVRAQPQDQKKANSTPLTRSGTKFPSTPAAIVCACRGWLNSFAVVALATPWRSATQRPERGSEAAAMNPRSDVDPCPVVLTSARTAA